MAAFSGVRSRRTRADPLTLKTMFDKLLFVNKLQEIIISFIIFPRHAVASL